MKKFTKLFMVLVFAFSVGTLSAQDTPSDQQQPATTAPANNENGTMGATGVTGNETPSSGMEQPMAATGATGATGTEQPMGATGGTTQEATTGSTGATGSSGKVKKDPQNQTQFLQPDMESKNYNFYNRKAISQPIMMSYDQDSAVYQNGKKSRKQQAAYLAKQYAFPAKPHDQWELGINFGAAYISGNVKPLVSPIGIVENVGAGFTIRKALSYVLSLRGGYNFMMMTGRNWQPDQNLQYDEAFHGAYDPRVNYWNNPALLASNTIAGIPMNKTFFYNYRTYVHEAHLEAIFNLGNISYHRERNLVNFYMMAGVSGFFFTTYMNALNKDGNVYDFSKVYELYLSNNTGDVNSRVKNQRKEALKQLNGIYDNTYESRVERANDKPGIKNWEFVPAPMVGFGLQFHVSKWVTLGLEERVIITQNHLDGYFWQQDYHAALVSHYDNISYTSLNLNIHLGGKKRTEPMYWLNPVYHTYKKLGDVDPQSMMEQMFKDDDEDGVPNYLDKQPNTPKGCPVDTHGVALDSDHDGITDCLDKEPYSPPGYPIDSNGVAIIPPNPCCDTTGYSNGNGVGANGLPNGEGGGGLGGNGRGRHGNSGYDCSKIELPAVMFDNDKYYLDPQYYGNLHQIAERMQMCPDMKLVVTGYDESHNDQKYNEQLGWNRANSAVDYLVEKYGISRDRFIIKYQGGKKAAAGTPYQKKMTNKVEFRYANEGETGDSNPPAPHPGLKAGSNK